MVSEPYSMRRQRVNLSSHARAVLESDKQHYFKDGEITNNRFYNTVISGFYRDAKASLSHRIAQQEKLLAGCLNENYQKIKASYRRQLQQQLQLEHPLGTEGLLFSLYKDNDALLYTASEINEGENYRKGVSGYLKALFEEFAQLPGSRREAVYFADRVECINSAIQAGQALQITVRSSGNIYWVRPCSVVHDANQAHLYLTGLSRAANTPRTEERIASFRISNILPTPLFQLPVSTEEKAAILLDAFGSQNQTDIEACLQALRCVPEEEEEIWRLLGIPRPPAYASPVKVSPPEEVMHALRGKMTLTNKEQKAIAQKIRQVDVPYLVGQEILIVMRLTPEGQQLYRSKSWQRPAYTKTEPGGIYTFSCSAKQVQNYFLSFGKDAVVIEPAWLQEAFHAHHRAAWEACQAQTEAWVCCKIDFSEKQPNILAAETTIYS